MKIKLIINCEYDEKNERIIIPNLKNREVELEIKRLIPLSTREELLNDNKT